MHYEGSAECAYLWAIVIRRYKEIWAIVASLILLAVLLVQWGISVYHNTRSEIESEVNLLFLDAVQEARDSIYGADKLFNQLQNDSLSFPNSIDIIGSRHMLDTLIKFPLSESRQRKGDSASFEIKSFTMNTDDTLFLVNEDTSLINKSKFSELHELIFTARDSSKAHDISVSFSDHNADIFMSFDSIIIIEVEDNLPILDSVFNQLLDDQSLELLNAKVQESDDEVNVTVESHFYTEELAMKETGFSSRRYVGIIENIEEQARRRIIPKLLLGLGLFGLFVLAFSMLYRSIQQQKWLVKVQNELVSNISHELKTPISVVNVALEALQKFDAAKDPAKTQRYIDISKREVGRLSTLVDKVMNISVSDDDTSTPSEVSLTAVAAEVVDSMTLRLMDSSISINYAHHGEPQILALPSQVKSVLYNLIDNAIKYSEKGTIKVNITTEPKWALITVADEGIGIDPTYQSHVFDKFFRVPTDDIHDVKGYGLGLHHVKDIVEQNGGSITMKSVKGQGTTFSIKWPLI